MADLDRTDLALLEALQRNARSTYAELGEAIGLRPPAVHDRIRKLEERGVLVQYGARLDLERVGLAVNAFIGVITTPDCDYDAFVAQVSALPEVLEVHSVAGEDSYMLKVATRNTRHLDALLTRLKGIPGAARTRTTVILATSYERPAVPLQELTEGDEASYWRKASA